MRRLGIYLRVEQLKGGPKPLPLTAYRALGMFNPSETSDAYFILSNDRDEIWFICNRHLRCLGVFPQLLTMRLALSALGAISQERTR